MYCFYNTSTGQIVGGTGYGAPRNDAGITLLPSGADAFVWLDETYWADVVNNLGMYKIVSGAPEALTQAEIDARNAAYVPPEPTDSEKLADARKQISILQASLTSVNSQFNSLIDYVMSLPTA